MSCVGSTRLPHQLLQVRQVLGVDPNQLEAEFRVDEGKLEVSILHPGKMLDLGLFDSGFHRRSPGDT